MVVLWDADKTEKHNIKLTNIITFDEFNDFMKRSGSHVQSPAQEQRMATGRRVKKTNKSRVTLTAAILFSLACAKASACFSFTIVLGLHENKLKNISRTS